MHEEEIDLKCPVTLDFFLKPVVLSSGLTVEEDVAKTLMRTKQKCPIHQCHITGYMPNQLIKNLVTRFLDANPDKRDQQYKPEEPAIDLSSAPISSAVDYNNAGHAIVQQPMVPAAAEAAPSLPQYLAVNTSLVPEQGNNRDLPRYYNGLVIGEGTSGKRNFYSAVNRYDHFDNQNLTRRERRTERRTVDRHYNIGADFKTKTFEQFTCRLWDTAGQAFFGSLTASSIRKSHFALIFAGQNEQVTARLMDPFRNNTDWRLFSLRYTLQPNGTWNIEMVNPLLLDAAINVPVNVSPELVDAVLIASIQQLRTPPLALVTTAIAAIETTAAAAPQGPEATQVANYSNFTLQTNRQPPVAIVNHPPSDATSNTMATTSASANALAPGEVTAAESTLKPSRCVIS